ncbi:DUF1648 domain-containing protein [Streptomyces catenulae]|uniref:DUF1648 domain-containing protein n=1 Tax=Streptomyces catenulae TaxID=66875 RepID=A0ABV2Z4R9_9ACTN|nr:DUF1648 domain-containing protein [Streptomyces catenulae]
MNPATPFTRPPADTLRVAIAAFPFLVAVAVVVGVHHQTADRLPDPLATHFGADGTADGFTSVHGFVLGIVLALLALGIGGAVLAHLKRLVPAAPWLLATGWSLAAVLAVPACATLLANAGAGRAEAARLPLWQLLPALAAGLLAGAVGLWLGGPRRRPEPSGAQGGPRLPLAAGERAGWSRTTGSPLLAALGLFTCCAGVLLGFVSGPFAGVALGLTGVVAGALASVRVTVDRRGLALAPALLPYAFRRIPLDRVTEATCRNVEPFAEFGGWGYRVRAHRSGLVLRSGEGIVLQLRSGREFVVTVDDAATAAALLNTLLDRARPHRGD